VNALDAIILIAAAGAAYAGYRVGFTGRALSWLGLTLGIVIGTLFVDDIGNALGDSTPRTRLIGALAFLFLVSILGQAVGIGAGLLLRRHLPARGILSTVDRTFGALAGLFSVLVIVWLLTPALANAPGWPARAARGSAVVRAVDDVAPRAPHSIEALGRLVGDAPFPKVFEGLNSPKDVGPPPQKTLPAAIRDRVFHSVVKIEGRACDLIQQGSGWVLDANLVVTNAHVVAGHESTVVITPGGQTFGAKVVGFDPSRDIALLRVNGLPLAALTQADGEVGSTGAVVGYPRGGPESEAPARIAETILARGTNIYRNASSTREVYVLASQLYPGRSGGPRFDAQGRVVGMAFAVDPGNATTAYALTHDEVSTGLAPMLKSGARDAVDDGPCLVG
jgi:S1-C subfamily serine protease